MTDVDSDFHLMDTKLGKRASFDTLDEARSALRQWIDLQRSAGEPVIELPTGQWKDSKLTVWISGPDHNIVPLES